MVTLKPEWPRRPCCKAQRLQTQLHHPCLYKTLGFLPILLSYLKKTWQRRVVGTRANKYSEPNLVLIILQRRNKQFFLKSNSTWELWKQCEKHGLHEARTIIKNEMCIQKSKQVGIERAKETWGTASAQLPEDMIGYKGKEGDFLL